MCLERILEKLDKYFFLQTLKAGIGGYSHVENKQGLGFLSGYILFNFCKLFIEFFRVCKLSLKFL